MILSGGALTLALVLVAAQGPRSTRQEPRANSGSHATRQQPRGAPGPSAKHKGSAPPAPPPRTLEKRVGPPPGSESGTSARRGEATTANAGAGDRSDTTASPGADPTTKTAKTKVYTFGAMDVEGKLKTPQLLYFLNRVKLELEMSAPDHRSFMKELEKTADDPNL
jgi:hypothetical protein